MDEYDVLIIGSGTAGQTAAHALVARGLHVGLVEKSDRPGGVCALAGCQAKKWFYEMTEIAARCRHLKDNGVVKPPEISWPDILAEKNRFTDQVPAGTINGLEYQGIEFIPGNACFKDHETITIEDETLKARYYVLASGAVPMTLPIAGAEHLITSTQFLDLKQLPPRLVFIGGGFISFEFAHFAARLGPENRQIQILEAADRPLGPFDAEMTEHLMDASAQEGIDIRTGVKIESVEKVGDGYLIKTSDDEIAADLVVHGAGRTADLEGLKPENAGIDYSLRGVAVNDRMQTSNPRVYAIGDCAATVQLARVADFEAQAAAANIAAAFDPTRESGMIVDYRFVPSLLFTYPQFGMVGKTEQALRQAGIEYRKSSASNVGWPTYRRIGMANAAYKILVGSDNRVLGAHIISDNASGMINTLRQAMMNGMTVKELYHSCIMTPYPSRESDLIYMLKPLTK